MPCVRYVPLPPRLRVTRTSVATFVFLSAAIGMLTAFRRRQILVVLALSLVLGTGLEYVFTRVFVIALP